jgi:PAS domain S-box-containing protein
MAFRIFNVRATRRFWPAAAFLCFAALTLLVAAQSFRVLADDVRALRRSDLAAALDLGHEPIDVELADRADGGAAAVAGIPWVLLAASEGAKVDARLVRLGWTIAGLVIVVLGLLGLLASLLHGRADDRRRLQAAERAERYANAIIATDDVVLRVDATGRIVDANPAADAMFGFGDGELVGRDLADFGEATPTPGSKRFRAAWRTRSGSDFDVDGTATYVADAVAGHTYIIARDVTLQRAETARLERLAGLHRLLRQTHQALRHHDEPMGLLREICADFIVGPRNPLVWAGWVDRDQGRVVPIAAVGAARGYVDCIDITLDPALPTSGGPTARCVNEGCIVVVASIQADARMATRHRNAARHGLASAAILPIRAGGEVVAVLAVYSDREAYFQDDELDLVREMAETISVALDASEAHSAAARLTAARAESEARLRAIIQAAPVPMHVFSTSGTHPTQVNDAFVRLFGYDEREFATLADWFAARCVDSEAHGRYPALRDAAVATARASGGAVAMPELTLRCRDGSLRTVQAHLSVVGNDVIKVWTDLTAIRAGERALRRREDIYAAMAGQARSSIALIDADTGGFLEFNTAAHATLGYSRDDFAALRVGDIDPDPVSAGRANQLAVGESMAFETVVRHRDGHFVDVRITVQRLRIDGRLCNAAIWADITTEHERARAVAEEAERHRLLFENAAHGIFVAGDDDRATQVNAMMLRMLRCSEADLLGTPPWQWSADFETEAGWRAARDGVLGGTGYTARLRRRDGTVFDADIHANRGELGGHRFTFFSITDVSDRVRVEQELRRAERLALIGQLTGGIAHDFNNLLTVISLNLEMVAAKLGESHGLHGLLSAALAAAYRGGELNSQLLAFARRQSLRPVLTDVDTFLPGLRELAARAVGERYELAYASAGDLPAILVDQAKLESAVLNLIINARDAMPDGGQIRIVTALVELDAPPGDLAPGAYVRLAVVDSGPGMTPEVRARAFEPFFTTKPLGKGTGLGLSTVMGFVSQSGGMVDIDSTPGQGAAVRMHFPAVASRPVAGPADQPAAVTPRRLRVLVVDDEPNVLAATTRLCQDMGLDAVSVDHPQAALARLRDGASVDLLFTDIIMPCGMNGIALAAEAVALRPGLRVLFMSGYSEDAASFRLAEDAELLDKPFRRQHLVAALRRLFPDEDAAGR